jgi:hypothetical protein
MPDDREVPGDERMQANIAGEPLTASVRDILDEHAETERRADEERRAEEAEQERMARRKADEARTVLRHTDSERRLRPRRAASKRGRQGGQAGAPSPEAIDPRLLVGGALVGVILAGGVRRLILFGALAAGAWALYRRVLEPAGDPGVVLQ